MGVAQTWNIDASHTGVGFSVKHMMVSKVRGRFTAVEGTVVGNPEDLTTAQIDVKIDATTIHTNSDDRDNHLRSADFFDTENYPQITFVSTNIVNTKKNKYDITGNMTIKNVTKEVTFEAETKISRKEFGLTWNQALEAGGVLVGDEIKIKIDSQINPAQ